jgi:hypothetical protein
VLQTSSRGIIKAQPNAWKKQRSLILQFQVRLPQQPHGFSQFRRRVEREGQPKAVRGPPAARPRRKACSQTLRCLQQGTRVYALWELQPHKVAALQPGVHLAAVALRHGTLPRTQRGASFPRLHPQIKSNVCTHTDSLGQNNCICAPLEREATSTGCKDHCP